MVAPFARLRLVPVRETPLAVITTTHIVTNALVARSSNGRPNRLGHLLSDRTRARAFVLGGVAPDLGLYLLTAGAAVFYPLARDMTLRDSMDFAFEDLFFNNPVWVIAQNTLHSPVVVLSLAAAGWFWGRTRLLAFAMGCLLHIALDIPVHHDDGPLVFFPLNWSFRVTSPVSYWDPDHFGRIVGPIDLAITILGGSYLLVTWWKRRAARETTPGARRGV